MTETATIETLSTALEEIRGTLTSLQASIKKNEEIVDAFEFPATVPPNDFSKLVTDFNKVKAKLKENFGLLENSLRDAFSQIEKNSHSIQTCIDEIRVVGGSITKLASPAGVPSSAPFTLLEL